MGPALLLLNGGAPLLLGGVGWSLGLCLILLALAQTLLARQRWLVLAEGLCAGVFVAAALMLLMHGIGHAMPTGPWQMSRLSVAACLAYALADGLLVRGRGQIVASLVYLGLGLGAMSALAALLGQGLVAVLSLSHIAWGEVLSSALLLVLGVHAWLLADAQPWLREWRRRQPGVDVFVYSIVLLSSMLMVAELSASSALNAMGAGVQFAVVGGCAVLGALLIEFRVVPVLRRMRRTEEALAAAQRRDQLLLQHAGEGVLGLDAHGMISFANAAAETMLGYGTGALVGVPVGQVVAQADAAALAAVPAVSGARAPTIVLLKRADAGRFEAQWVVAPVHDGDEQRGAVVLFSDITERRRAERALERWRQVFEHAGWGIAVLNARTHAFELVNPAFARMHAWEDANALLGRDAAVVCLPDAYERLSAAESTASQPVEWETWHVRRDGSALAVLVGFSVLRDANGQVAFHVLNVQDVTERQRDQRILREREAELARAQAQARLGSWALERTEQGDVLTVSTETRRMFGMGNQTAVNLERFVQHVHDEDRDFVSSAWEAARHGDQYDIEHRIVTAMGVRWVRQRAELEFDGLGNFVRALGTVQDVTEARNKEEELRDSRQALRDLAAHHDKIREDERTRIAREIHDELGQYLTALRMDAAMLEIRYGGLDAGLTQLAAGMKQTIDTTISVVRNIAASLRPGALDLGLVPAVEWLLQDLQNRTGIHCALHAELGDLELDDERATAVFRILQESLTNIVRHAHAQSVNVRIEHAGALVAIEVEDDGVGFDTGAVRKRRTFGLMGIRERARAFGGRARIDTQPGKGTVVHVQIPMHEGEIA